VRELAEGGGPAWLCERLRRGGDLAGLVEQSRRRHADAIICALYDDKRS
jgi:hypothetical protein